MNSTAEIVNQTPKKKVDGSTPLMVSPSEIEGEFSIYNIVRVKAIEESSGKYDIQYRKSITSYSLPKLFSLYSRTPEN